MADSIISLSTHGGVVWPLSSVWLFVLPWTVALQAPLSMEFSRQKYWSGLPLPSPVTSYKSEKKKAYISNLFLPLRSNTKIEKTSLSGTLSK